MRPALVAHNLVDGHDEANAHDDAAKRHDSTGKPRLPAPRGKPHVAQRRQNVRQRARARRANELKHGAQVAREQRERRGADDQAGGEDDVAVRVEGLAGEVVLCHDLAADKRLEGQRGQHVEAEAEARNVDENVVGREVVEDVALR